MKKEFDLLIIGSVPPPIGGVTIYNSRLYDWMVDEDFKCSQIDVKKCSLVTILNSIRRSKICHISMSNEYAIFLLVLVCFFFRINSVFTLHRNFVRHSKARGSAISFASRLADRVIVLNEISYQLVKNLNRKTQLIGTNIPPFFEEKLPDDISKLLEKLGRLPGSIVVTNAFRKVVQNDVEVYGIHELIRHFSGKSETLIILDPSGDYKADVLTKYGDNLASNIIIISQRISFFTVLEYADIFIRNTSTDGDSLSIHEAMHQGVVVWATDVVSRPEGTNLYKKISEVDLKKKNTKSYASKIDIENLKALYNEMSL